MALGVPNYLPRNNFIRYLLRKRQKFKIGHMPPRAALQVRSASSSPFSESLTSRPNYPGELSWQTNCFGNMAAAVEEKKEEPSGVYVYSPKPPLETTLTAKDLSYTMNVIRGVPHFFRLWKSEKIPRSQTYSFGPKFFQIFSACENLGFFFQALFELLFEPFWRSF